MSRITLPLAVVGLMCSLFVSSPSQAEEIRLNSIGVRGGVSGSSPIGKKETEYFQQYDVMADWSMPWEWYSASGWGVGTRLMGTVGAVTAAGDTALVTTLIPGFVFGKKDGWLSLELGGGGALFSQHHFTNQSLGGCSSLSGIPEFERRSMVDWAWVIGSIIRPMPPSMEAMPVGLICI